MQKFDLTSQEFKANPFPTLNRMRAAGPVVRTKLPIMGKVWLATSYEAVNALLRDHRTFVRERRNAGKNRLTDIQWWATRLVPWAAENMLSKDEPDHRRLRTLVEDAFKRRSVDDMRGRLETLADDLLDRAEAVDRERGAVDFLDFARQFPLAVISELLGLPEEDRPMFRQWASSFSNVNSMSGVLSLIPSLLKMSRYFREQIRTCRRQPRPGLLSLLTEVQNEGDSLSDAELTAMAFLLLFAGHETTVHLVSTGLVTLLQHPEQKAELQADWRKAPAAIDEMLRYNTPVQLTKPRLAARDTQFFGQNIKQGQLLMAMLAAANSDPAQFDEPERFDIGRTPNPHVGFGAGIHVCLGLKLAKLEAEIAFQRLLNRFPDLALAGPLERAQWTTRIGLRALSTLAIRLHG